jgi:hypothetical protein
MADMARVHRRRIGRIAIVAVVCLLLGAATTVGVAWYLQLTADFDPSPPWYDNEAAAAFVWPSWAGSPPDPPRSALVVETTGCRSETLMMWGAYIGQVERDAVATTLRTGWPFPCLWCGLLRFEDHTTDPQWPTVMTLQGAAVPLNTTSWTSQERWFPPMLGGGSAAYLPLSPLWPGFVADTALYAAAWWLLIFAPLPLYRAGRRRFRVSRGMCGSCGYDLKGSPGGACPECGRGAGGRA